MPRLLDMHLIEIDLDVTGVGFVVTPSNGSAAGETVGRTTRQFASAFGTQVAVNGGFSAWVSGSNYAVEGLAAYRGAVYSEFQEFRTFALNISQDNVATILRSVTRSGTDRSPDVPLYNTLPGEARLLRNGMIIQYENESLHPRTAVGLSADERRLFILTVDGRNPGHSLGVTRPELADFLRMFGAHNAINLDGGGSSTLVFSDLEPRLVNVPVGVNNTPGSERTVGSNFGIYAPPVPAPAHVAIGVDAGSRTQGQAGHPQLVTALSLTKSGAGTLVLNVDNVFAGTTLVEQGELRIARAGAVQASPVIVRPTATVRFDPGIPATTPGITLAGGTLAAETLAVNAATGVGSLLINSGTIANTTNLAVGPGGLVSLPARGRMSLGVASLAVDEAQRGGRIDLGSGQVVVAPGGIGMNSLLADLVAGRNGGDWNGATGIMTSASSSGGPRDVGYVVAGDGTARISFAAAGDVDLSGHVDVFDLVAIETSRKYGSGQGAIWSEGDFNYDGISNVFDIIAIGTAGAYGGGTYFPAAVGGLGGDFAAVPEPATWAVMAAAAAALSRILRPARRGEPLTAAVVAAARPLCRAVWFARYLVREVAGGSWIRPSAFGLLAVVGTALASAAELDDKIAREARVNAFYEASFANRIDAVTVTRDRVIVAGSVGERSGQLRLVEIRPEISAADLFPRGGCHFVLEPQAGIQSHGPVSTTPFERVLPRLAETVDRTTSRWALAEPLAEGRWRLASRWSYATDLSGAAGAPLPRLAPRPIKGMGGVSPAFPLEELVELGVHNITVNLLVSDLLAAEPHPGWPPFEYGGHVWHVNAELMAEWDKLTSFAGRHDIVVSGILLIPFRETAFGRLLVHPEANRAGHYAMPDFTTAAGPAAYEAALEVLAQRYCAADSPKGRIVNWIVHNEVGYGWEWTNMGRQPPMVYMDHYLRSLRLVHNVMRRHDPHARVFISLTHHWNNPADPSWKAYVNRDLLDRLCASSRLEGDFAWGVAYHPYPQDLRSPEAWNDSQPTDDFDTPLITPRNIAVLDRWMHLPKMRDAQGRVRGVLLSEQGFNTPDYSPESELLQAAGLVFMWRQMRGLASIEAFHNHRWVDHPDEDGLLLGLRRLPAAGGNYGEKKIAWDVYRALDTGDEQRATRCVESLLEGPGGRGP